MKLEQIIRVKKEDIKSFNLVIQTGKNGQDEETGFAKIVHSKKKIGGDLVCNKRVSYRENLEKGTTISMCKECAKKIEGWQKKKEKQQYSLF